MLMCKQRAKNDLEELTMQSIRIYEMPKCKMVSSGIGMFGEEKFERFMEWFSLQERSMFPKDFLFWDVSGFHWLYLYEAGMNVPEEFEIIDFDGGLYAVATDIDQKTDTELMKQEVDSFLSQNGLVRDNTRQELGNIITSPMTQKILGYEQMDYYTPVKAKE